MRNFFRMMFVGVLTIAAFGPAFGASTRSYVITVHLHSGKQVVCAVNEPLKAQDRLRSQPLTVRELNEAQVDATARLRRQPGDKNHYPSPSMAPKVECS
ncbi:hypothetical protein [Paraburkholderia xenovorans]